MRQIGSTFVRHPNSLERGSSRKFSLRVIKSKKAFTRKVKHKKARV